MGNTFIVQTGAYGLNLGKGHFTFTPGLGVSPTPVGQPFASTVWLAAAAFRCCL